MSDPARTLFDGDHETPFLCAAPVVWVDEETRATMTKLKFRVRAPYYRPQERGSTHRSAQGFLVGQPQPRPVGGDLQEYEILYATVPGKRVEPMAYVYPFQIILTGGTSGPELAELPIPVTALAGYRYVQTSRPEDIVTEKAFKITEVGGFFKAFGRKPGPGTQRILAEDEQVSRWKEGGDIWEIRNITVDVRSLYTVT